MGRICQVTIKLSRWRAKTMTTRASACNPIDSVSAAGTVRVAQDFISGLKFSLIDFSGRLRSCPGCKRQLIKPSELWAVLFLSGVNFKQRNCPLKFVHNHFFLNSPLPTYFPTKYAIKAKTIENCERSFEYP